ncbi:Uncharacterised protein [Klebsiella pneumoniae]|uniref:Uncharacterized protein n=1 Tax=Klebsiella pneumoniae TaxID=573 RepID=A0A2X3CKY0_KLEPN|nr:Uncharacterised protein [Klebsiella pneumoniae]
MPLVNQILGRHIAAEQRVILNQIAIAIKGAQSIITVGTDG